MPLYHFHIHDGASIIDSDGTMLPDWHAARVHAIAYAGEILRDEAHRIALGEDWRMEVTDETGLVLFRLDFTVLEAPTLHGRRQRVGSSSANQGGGR